MQEILDFFQKHARPTTCHLLQLSQPGVGRHGCTDTRIHGYMGPEMINGYRDIQA
jgi:hypothetical protein